MAFLGRFRIGAGIRVKKKVKKSCSFAGSSIGLHSNTTKTDMEYPVDIIQNIRQNIKRGDLKLFEKYFGFKPKSVRNSFYTNTMSESMMNSLMEFIKDKNIYIEKNFNEVREKLNSINN